MGSFLVKRCKVMSAGTAWMLLIGMFLGGMSWVVVGCMGDWDKTGLRNSSSSEAESPSDSSPSAPSPLSSEPPLVKGEPLPEERNEHTEARQRMIDQHLRARGIRDRRVLEAMARVPRERFVPESQVPHAYEDRPLPIGHGQTISQPYIVAFMTELARPTPKSKALDIGTGSGYQAAVLAELCKEVYSIEILDPLAQEARKRLEALGYKNITVRTGDGYQGWPEKAPFDVIIVAAAPDHVPKPLIEQLAPGGRLVIPVGSHWASQELLVIEKQPDGTIRERSVASVAFVPMTGKAQQVPPDEEE